MLQSIPFGEVGIELRRCKIGSFPNPFRFESRWVKGFSLLSGCPDGPNLLPIFSAISLANASSAFSKTCQLIALLANLNLAQSSCIWPFFDRHSSGFVPWQRGLSDVFVCKIRNQALVTVTNFGHGQQSLLQLGSGCQCLSLSLRCSGVISFYS